MPYPHLEDTELPPPCQLYLICNHLDSLCLWGQGEEE